MRAISEDKLKEILAGVESLPVEVIESLYGATEDFENNNSLIEELQNELETTKAIHLTEIENLSKDFEDRLRKLYFHGEGTDVEVEPESEVLTIEDLFEENE